MHPQKEIISLQRDCDATGIPSGLKVQLFKGTELILLQSLGGAFTVMTHQGEMSSVAGKDADAIGKEIPPEARVENLSGTGVSIEDLVWKQLKTCYDPEIPHNIVDLGLVYECTNSKKWFSIAVRKLSEPANMVSNEGLTASAPFLRILSWPFRRLKKSAVRASTGFSKTPGQCKYSLKAVAI